MATLLLGNSYSRIMDLTKDQERMLKNELSYTVGSYHQRFGPKKKSLLDRHGNFPTGLYHYVAAFLMQERIKVINLDTTVRPLSGLPTSIQGVTPYKAQLDALAAAKRHSRGTIVLPTGAGKSLVIALIAAHYNVRTLVVVPNLEIKKQLSNSLSELLKGNSNMVVENIDSKALRRMKDFDMLIIDEAHHAAAKTYQKLNKTAWSGIYYRYFLTATPFRNSSDETLLFESLAGLVIYQLTYQDAVSSGYIVPVESYFMEIPKQSNDCYTWSEVYSQLVVKNTIRNEMLALLALRLSLSGASTLLLVKEVAHGQLLSDLTQLPFINGSDEYSREYIRQFSNGGIKAVIATEGMLGEGVDSRACEYVIIAGLGKAKSSFQQKVGRAVRKYPGKESAKVIIVKDESHKFTKRHFKEQCKILKEEYNSVPVKLEIE